LELQFYEDQKHLDDVSKKMNKDEDAGKLGKTVYGSINSWIIYRRMV